ncbi:tyrosine-type recombinase/integrase [Catellatospora chokoriensis]|uniref:Integrase n=1 Tax=Catellatospora chokoriensis TaxID=310353 RepID=A0A8J3K1P0_9ACTN|nr:site-specific integrase [Catellatospora chokoriensis]GIF86919.1 integrase [Catellatospora chokoriensis]
MTTVVEVPRVNLIARPKLVNHEHLLARPRSGARDVLTKSEVLALLPQLGDWQQVEKLRGVSKQAQRVKGVLYRQQGWLRGANKILAWLKIHPGRGWQERWVNSGADKDLSWIEEMDPFDGRCAEVQRADYTGALAALFLLRVVLPSYDVLTEFKCGGTLARVRQLMRPDVFARVHDVGVRRSISKMHLDQALAVLSKIVLHTGRDVDQLTPDDLLELFAWSLSVRGRGVVGLHLAWDLLADLGILPPGSTMRSRLLHGQRPTSELVDDHQIRSSAVRDVLIRYLDQRRAALDYSTLRSQAGILAGRFWSDVEAHHPGIDSLRLPESVAQAWKERIQLCRRPDGELIARQDLLHLLTQVRAFYLDIAEWAREDPSWVPWAAPSPVTRREVQGHFKTRKQRQAVMHQRIRERLPHLPLLADTAHRLREQTASLLAAAQAQPMNTVFDHSGRSYRRTRPNNNVTRAGAAAEPWVHVKDLDTGKLINATQEEDSMFWSWAIIETFRHTGVRVEELLEITHLALVSYRLPDTAELVPLLQIVPSKSNEERLLLISPELASVLASIVTRLRAQHGGAVPLVTRYDEHERLTGPPLPHLFQRCRGGRPNVISSTHLKNLINKVLAATGLKDATGQPLIYTPHDFRRMFATDAVTGGLPVHIAARLLGHASLETTQAYLAVFQDDMIRAYRSYLQERRSVRPAQEYREPTDDEWHEFQQHFQTRKLELGTCGRPYGSPCKHEHACIRCPMLHVDPGQQQRLAEIIQNLGDRISEARMNGWLGEVQGLQISLDAAANKMASLRRTSSKGAQTAMIGMPVIRQP